MTGYRLYFLNEAGRILRAEVVDAAEDAGAFGAAEALDHAHHIEIWERDRRVGVVKPAGRSE